MKKGYLYVILASVGWATLGVIGRFAYSAGVDTLTVVTWRAGFSFILTGLYLYFFKREDIRIEYRDIPRFALLGVFGLAANFYCYLSAIKYTTVATVSVLLYTYPAIVSVVSAFLFKEKLDNAKIAALFLTAIGCIFVVGAYNPKAFDLNVPGVLLGLGTGMAMVLYTIYSKILLRSYSNYTIYFWGFLFATLTFVILKPASVSNIFKASAHAVFYVFLAALVPTLLSYGLYTAAMKDIGTSRAAITCTLEPALTAIFSYVILGEALALPQWAGMAIVMSGIVLLNLPKASEDVSTKELVGN